MELAGVVMPIENTTSAAFNYCNPQDVDCDKRDGYTVFCRSLIKQES